MGLVITEIAAAAEVIRVIYSNTAELFLLPPFTFKQYGQNQTANTANNFYILGGRVQYGSAERLKKVKIGLGITRIDGVPFAGDFEDLGDAIAELLAAATNAGGGTPTPIFGQLYTYTEDETTSNTNSATFQNKLTLLSPLLPTGQQFLLHYSVEAFMSNTSGRVGVQVLKDAILQAEYIKESKDSRDRHAFSGIKQIAGTGAAASFVMQFNNEGNGTASVRRARLAIYRVL